MGCLSVAAFIEPHERIFGEERERARLLTGLLLAVLVLGTGNVAIQSVVIDGFASQTLPYVTIGLVIIGLALLVSKSPHYRFAAMVAVAVPIIAAACVSVNKPDDPAWWAFAAMSPVFATLFFSIRTTVVVALATVTSVILLQLAHRNEIAEPTFAGSIAFSATFIPVLVLAAWHRARIERHRLRRVRLGEQATAESRRLEALGRLAGGVAHDFNNLLTVVSANADLLARECRSASDATMLREIQTAAERAASLTSQLLTYARQQPRERQPVDIVSTVRDLTPLLRPLLGSSIELAVSHRIPRAVVMGDRTQIEQVVLNLAANARDALESGGRLDLDVDRTDGDRGDVVMTVRDNGRGMNEETMAHIFEPFYTTNESQGHSGLGLAIVKGVIDQLGGSVEVVSRPERGTTFRIILPTIADEPPLCTPVKPPVTASRFRLLLVDDDELVLRAIERSLLAQGHTVTAVSSSRRALELVRDGDVRADALVTDINMPDLDGPALAAAARLHVPELPVIFLSGNPDIGSGAADLAHTAVLVKPATGEQIVAAIGDLGSVARDADTIHEGAARPREGASSTG